MTKKITIEFLGLNENGHTKLDFQKEGDITAEDFKNGILVLERLHEEKLMEEKAKV